MRRRLYLVCYDIRNPKRWRRVFRLMERTGVHRQYSVFLVRKDRTAIFRLAESLKGLIDETEDSVVIVPVGRGLADSMIELGPAGLMPGARVAIL